MLRTVGQRILLGIVVLLAGCGGPALDSETGTYFNAHVDDIAPDYRASTFAVRVQPFDSNVQIREAYYFDEGSNQQRFLSLSNSSNSGYLVNGTLITTATYQGQKLKDGILYFLRIVVTYPETNDRTEELWFVQGLNRGRAQSPF